jgi:hypothetical protein
MFLISTPRGTNHDVLCMHLTSISFEICIFIFDLFCYRWFIDASTFVENSREDRWIKDLRDKDEKIARLAPALSAMREQLW